MKKIILFILILTFLSLTNVLGQFYEETRQSGVGNPFFNVEIFRTIAADFESGRLYVYSSIVNDDLTFVKSDSSGEFRADFEWEVSIVNEENNQLVASHNAQREVYEVDFRQTNDRTKNILLSTLFDIPPGNYALTTQVRDVLSNKTVSRKLEVKMPDFDKNKLNISDLLFLNEANVDESENLQHYIPRVESNFSRMSPMIYLYTEIYSNEYPVTVSIHYRLSNSDEETELDTVVYKELTKPLTSHIFEIDKRKISKNRYRCTVKVHQEDQSVERWRNFSFYWVNVPETSDDITLALRQMRYILQADSLDYFLDAPLQEQQKFFTRFWSNRDPNPGTESNELMEEYYSRVNFANREYSSFSDDGWLSDRGRILIKFGYPDDIERHPFEMNSVPYVIWRYYSLRKVFVFADKTGFGDYRLLPSYQSQEYY